MKEIGIENLPNAYINEVEILPSTKRRRIFKVEMIVKDHRTRGKFSWYDSEDLGKYLQVMVVCSGNQRLNDRLDSGNFDFNKKFIKIFDRSENVKTFTIPIKQNEVDDRFELIDNKKVYSFIYSKKIIMPKNLQNIKVYCAVMLDTRTYSNEQGIDLLGPLVSSYSGPVASETVIKNGRPVVTTTVLLDKDGNTYSGPYHKHSSGRLMEGSFHSNRPHDFLTEQQAPNMKIKNYIDMPLSIRASKARGSRKIISQMTTSYSDKGSGSLFSLDIKNLLIEKTLRGRILASVNPYLLNKAIQKTKILKMQIFEEKLQTKVMLSKIGTKQKASKRRINKKRILITKDSVEGSTITTVKRNKKTIKEVVLSDDLSHRTFIIEQDANYSIKGERRYSVVFEIFNPIENMILEIYKELLQGFNILKSYYFRSNLPNNTTSNNKRFTQKFIDKETLRANSLLISIKQYVEVYSIFNNLPDDAQVEMSQYIMSHIIPEYATPKSLAWFFRKYQILISFFKKSFKIKQRSNSDVGSRGNTSKNGAGFRIFVGKTFKDTISFEKTKNILNVLGSREAMPIITKQQFIKRYSIERTKFLSSRPNFIATRLFQTNRQLARNMSKINEYLPSYLTPLGISKDKGIINTESFESLREDDVLEFYKKRLSKPQDKTFIEKKEKKQSKLRIKKPKKLRTLDKLKPVTENLGDNSSFINTEERFEKSKTTKLSRKIKNSFSLKDIPERSFKDYSLKNKNLIERILRRPEESIKIPLSIKTLMVAENNRTKNNELLTKTDFISNYKTFPAFDILYNTPIKVEFTNDGKNWQLLTQTIFNNLNENVICRLSYYYYEGLTYKKDLPIANEYFILKGSVFRDTRLVSRLSAASENRLLDLKQQASLYNLTYSTTNLITQPRSRNTAFGTAGEVRSQQVEIDTSTTTTVITTTPTTSTTSTTGGGGSYGY